MNKRVAKLISKYASTYAGFGDASGRAMERIAKRKWNAASDAEKRSIKVAMERRVRKHRDALDAAKKQKVST